MSDKKQMRIGEQRGYRPQEVVVKMPRAGERTVTTTDAGEVKTDDRVSGILKRTRERLGLSSRPVKG